MTADERDAFRLDLPELDDIPDERPTGVWCPRCGGHGRRTREAWVDGTFHCSTETSCTLCKGECTVTPAIAAAWTAAGQSL
jgi:DnaJ-class molecular chaperone